MYKCRRVTTYISNLEEPIRRYLSERHVRQFPFATVCHKIARRNETKKMFQGDKKYLHVQNDCPFFQSIYMDVFVLGIELLQKRKKTFS